MYECLSDLFPLGKKCTLISLMYKALSGTEKPDYFAAHYEQKVISAISHNGLSTPMILKIV